MEAREMLIRMRPIKLTGQYIANPDTKYPSGQSVDIRFRPTHRRARFLLNPRNVLLQYVT